MRSLAAAYTFVTILLGSSASSAEMSAPQLIRRACAAYDLRAIILVEEGARTHKLASVLVHEAFVILEARALCAGDQPISGLVL